VVDSHDRQRDAHLLAVALERRQRLVVRKPEFEAPLVGAAGRPENLRSLLVDARQHAVTLYVPVEGVQGLVFEAIDDRDALDCLARAQPGSELLGVDVVCPDERRRAVADRYHRLQFYAGAS